MSIKDLNDRGPHDRLSILSHRGSIRPDRFGTEVWVIDIRAI